MQPTIKLPSGNALKMASRLDPQPSPGLDQESRVLPHKRPMKTWMATAKVLRLTARQKRPNHRDIITRILPLLLRTSTNCQSLFQSKTLRVSPLSDKASVMSQAALSKA